MNKLFIFLPTLGFGGAEISLSRVSQHLSDNFDLDVKLVIAKKLNHKLELQISDTLDIEYLDSSRTFFSIIKLTKLINKEKPDAILTTLPTPNFIVTVLKKLRLINTKVFLREANSNYLNWNKNLINKIKGKIAVFSFNNSDANIFISHELKENVEKYIFNKNNKVIYNPVFTEDFFDKADEEILDLEFINKEIWITTSRLEHQKGLDILFNAAYKFLDKKNFMLLIVGDGSLENTYKQNYPDLPLKFLGNVDNPLKYLKSADIFFFPSRREGLGNSLIEAQILGKNIISSDCPSGPKEIIDLFKNGVLFESGNVDSLSECIKNMEIRKDISISVEIINKFSVSEVSNKYYQFLKSSIN